MKYIHCSEYFEYIRTLIARDILRFGLAAEKPSKKSASKIKKSKSKEDSLNVACNAVFGNSLSSLPKMFVEGYGYIPRFLVDCLTVLNKHMEVEGLFRKAGSLARQREFKERVDGGESVDDSCGPLDVCCLIKQFFRELPNPLMTFELHSTFLNCFIHFKEDKERCISVILNLCLLLPQHNLSTLMYLMDFLSNMVAHSESNKMDASNISICLAPNLLYSIDVRNKKVNVITATPSKQKSPDTAVDCALSLGTEATIQVETDIIRLLVENAGRIGEVTESMYNRAAAFASSMSSLTTDADEGQEVGCHEKKKVLRKRGSGSLQGLVSNLGSSFSRWLSNRSSVQDTSSNNVERSSIVSVDDSACREYPESPGADVEYDARGNVEEMMSQISKMTYTPKIMTASKGNRLIKRKADEDCCTPILGFSATKRKALMQFLPHKSIYGLKPFSEHLKQGDDVATPTGVSDLDSECTTANRSFNVNVSNVSSVGSGAKLRRIISMRKTSGFSPKQNVRMKFKGLLRRLSGKKERKVENKKSTKYEANESIGSKNTSLFGCSKKMEPAASTRKPLLGPFVLPDDELDSIIFGEVGDHFDFSKVRGYTPPSICDKQLILGGMTDGEECRDLKRIREQRDTEELLNICNKLKRGYHEVSSLPQRAANAVLPDGMSDDGNPFYLDESRKTSGEASLVEENLVDLSGSLLRRGRPNTVKNGLRAHTFQKKDFPYDFKELANEEFPQKMNILETSPISSASSKFRNIKDDDELSVCNFEDDRYLDETVVKVLDVAFTEEDLQSVISESMSEEPSPLRVEDGIETRSLQDACSASGDLHNFSPANDVEAIELRGNSSFGNHKNTSDDNDPRDEQTMQFPPGTDAMEWNSSPRAIKEIPPSDASTFSSDDNRSDTIQPSDSQIFCPDVSEVKEGSKHSNISLKANAQIRRPSFMVTTDLQNLISRSGQSFDRHNFQSEGEYLKSSNAHQSVKENLEFGDELLTLKTFLPKKDDEPVQSKKVARLPISSAFNVTAFGERNSTGVTQPDKHSEEHSICLSNTIENTVLHLPPMVPCKPKRLEELPIIARQAREECRILQRLHEPNEAAPKATTHSTAQPKIREPLIASRVAKYLATVQESSSTTRVSSPRSLRSPMKSLKRLQQATSPKSLKTIGGPQMRRSPMKPPTPQNQANNGCAIKFDLDV